MKQNKLKKAEGYFDVCVGLIALLSVLVLTLNIYSFLTLKQDMDEISEQLIEIATYEGQFGDEFNDRVDTLKSQFFDFDVSTTASQYFNTAEKSVQLGDTMWVTITVHTSLKGLGVVSIPITCNSSRSGISERYWK